MSAEISVLLVDDHALVRRGFRRILEDDPSIIVVAEAGDAAEAIRLARLHHPKVVIMDCALPGMNGLDAARYILESEPEAAILMLSMYPEHTWVRQALDAGARGYLLKNILDLELVAAVKSVADGAIVIDPQVSRQVQLRGERDCGLSGRELEILQMIVSGKSNKQCAAALGLSVNTVAVHRANIMQTLGIHNTAELVVYAIRNGLVSLP